MSGASIRISHELYKLGALGAAFLALISTALGFLDSVKCTSGLLEFGKLYFRISFQQCENGLASSKIFGLWKTGLLDMISTV